MRRPIIRADHLLQQLSDLEYVYGNDPGAKVLAKALRRYVTSLAESTDYQRGVLLEKEAA